MPFHKSASVTTSILDLSEAVVPRTCRLLFSEVPRRTLSCSDVSGKLRAVTEHDGYVFLKSLMAALLNGMVSIMRRTFPGKPGTRAFSNVTMG